MVGNEEDYGSNAVVRNIEKYRKIEPSGKMRLIGRLSWLSR